MNIKALALVSAFTLTSTLALASEPKQNPTTNTPNIPTVDPISSTLSVFQQDFITFKNWAETESIAGRPQALVFARDMQDHAQNWFKAMQERMIETIKANASLKDQISKNDIENNKNMKKVEVERDYIKAELGQVQTEFDLYKKAHPNTTKH